MQRELFLEHHNLSPGLKGDMASFQKAVDWVEAEEFEQSILEAEEEEFLPQ